MDPTSFPTWYPTANPTRTPTLDGCDFSYIDYMQTCHDDHGWHWITDGDGDTEGGIKLADECTRNTDTKGYGVHEFGDDIGVQCCDSNTIYRKELGCKSAKNYYEAKQLCDEAGYRLCTIDEIAALGQSAGCKFDVFLVWTSDECTPSDESAARKPRLNFGGEESSGELVVSVNEWSAGLVLLCVFAVLSLAIMLCKLRAGPKYATVALTDSEAPEEDELRAINVE